MRYILDSEGYVYDIAFGSQIECNLGTCTEYTGDVPSNYTTIDEWAIGEIDRLNAWKIVDGNLVFDVNKYNELKSKWSKEEAENQLVCKKYVDDKLVGIGSTPKNTKALFDKKTTDPFRVIQLNDTSDFSIDKLVVNADTSVNKLDLIINGSNMLPNKMVSGKKDNVTYTVNNDKTIKLVATEPEPGKNLLPNNATSQTINGITFTVNDDGTILVNGTNTSTNWTKLTILSDFSNIPINEGSYLLSCEGCGQQQGTNLIFSLYKEGETSLTSRQVTSNNSYDINVTGSNVTICRCELAIAPNCTVDNVVFKPMLRLASVTDDTYEPYGSKPVEIDLAGNSTNTDTLLTFKKNIDYYLSGLNGVTLKMYSYDGIDRTEVYSGTDGTIIFTDSDKHITHITLSINSAIDKAILPMLNLGTSALSYEMYQEAKTTVDLLIYTLMPSATLTPSAMLAPKYDGKITVTFENDKVTFFDYKNKELGSIEMPKTLYPNSTIYTHQDTTMVLNYVSSTSKGVPYDQVIKSINNSSETITINTDRLDIDGIATFTNNKLGTSGSTVINGDNITTGTISSDRLNINEIATFTNNKLGTSGSTVINGDNITTGTISSDRLNINEIATFTNNKLGTSGSTVINGDNITTGTISSDRLSLVGKEINLTSDNVVIKSTNFNVTKEGKITAKEGSIGGWNIGAYKIFNEGATSGNACCMQTPNYEYETGKYTNWVFAAGATNHDAYGDAKFRVNKAGAMYSTSGSIGGWNISSSGLTATGKAACEINKNGNIVMAGNYGQIKFDTNPVRVTTASKMIISDNYNTSTMVGTNDTIAIRAFNGTVQINSNYGVYAGSNRLDGSSSKAIKENIKPIEEEYANDIYNEVKKMPYYTYDYKEKYGDKDNIGFVIEDIEDTCLKRVLKINQNGENKDVKNFGTVDLSKMNLLLIKMLMDKIETLEKALKEERERDNNE